MKEACETTQNKRAETPAEGIQLEVWLVEVSGGELRVSPNFTGRILSWGRGGQEVEGSRTKGSKARLCPFLSSCAEPMAAEFPRMSPSRWTRNPCPTYHPRLALGPPL